MDITSIARVLSALFFVITSLILFLYLLKKKNQFLQNRNGLINILDSVNLDNQRKMYFVEVSGKKILLVFSGNSVKSIEIT
jgi:flagellar biogenesis protein FliO